MRPDSELTPAPHRRDVAAKEPAELCLRPGLPVDGLGVDVRGGLEAEVVLPTSRCLESREHLNVRQFRGRLPPLLAADQPDVELSPQARARAHELVGTSHASVTKPSGKYAGIEGELVPRSGLLRRELVPGVGGYKEATKANDTECAQLQTPCQLQRSLGDLTRLVARRRIIRRAIARPRGKNKRLQSQSPVTIGMEAHQTAR